MTEVGKVIRFDHRKGYGFVDVLNKESENYGRELFFHYSEIKCMNTFKKVYPGEIVSFEISRKEGEDRDICVNLRGVYDTKLMIDNPSYIYKVSPKRNFVNSVGVETCVEENNESCEDNKECVDKQ